MNTGFAEVVNRGTYPGPLVAIAETPTTVFVVDDDASVRRSVENVVASIGYDVETCASAEEFLSLTHPKAPCCLLVGVNLPGLSGLALQQQMADRCEMPIIFITGHSGVRATVRAMKAGAVDVLTKPVSPDLLLSAVESAIDMSRAALVRKGRTNQLRGRYASLTPREREVMTLVVAGLLNKQVGFELGISENTVKAHRGKVMRKMEAQSLAELVRMADSLGIPPHRPPENQ